MGKLSKNKKAKGGVLHILNHSSADHVARSNGLSASASEILTSEELLDTVQTLEILEKHPELLQDARCKRIRQLLFSLHASKHTTSIEGRIGEAIKDGRWWDALGGLEEIQFKKVVPKLGNLCRWVRDCDGVSSGEETDTSKLVFRVLDAIIRAADPSLVGVASNSRQVSQVGQIRIHEPYLPPFCANASAALPEGIADEKISSSSFSVIYSEKGINRNPPNQFDMTLYTNIPGIIHLPEFMHPPTRVDISTLPGVFILQNVLSPLQCRQIILSGETIGFTADAPLSTGKQSVLAHNFFWMPDTQLVDFIYERVKELLPQTMGGQCVAGLNARWRVYRYRPGSIYRPHIDGAWPGSLIGKDGTYYYDGYGDRWSKLTFLIRLNDDFTGGATTYFTPSSDVGIMDATPVHARTGDCLVFPHGATEGTILHEGSKVVDTGRGERDAKYVIRTEVLYLIPGHERKDI